MDTEPRRSKRGHQPKIEHPEPDWVPRDKSLQAEAKRSKAAAAFEDDVFQRAEELLREHAPERRELYAGPNADGEPAVVRCGGRFSPILNAKIMALLAKFIPGPEDDRWKKKSHMTITFAKLNKNPDGREILNMIHEELRSTFLVELVGGRRYQGTDIFFKLRRGDLNPWHKDVWTGDFNLSRGGVYGARLLYNIGAMPDAVNARRLMSFRNSIETWSTDAGLVIMEKQSAGDGGQGEVEHARDGDGVTLTLDLALPCSTVQTSGKIEKHNTPVFYFFRALPEGRNENPQPHRRYGSAAAERAEAAAEDAAAATAGPHCWWCGSASSGHHWCYSKNNGRLFCLRCFANHQGDPESERPAAKVCPAGCARCDPKRYRE